jgi:hypothetical protein
MNEFIVQEMIKDLRQVIIGLLILYIYHFFMN